MFRVYLAIYSRVFVSSKRRNWPLINASERTSQRQKCKRIDTAEGLPRTNERKERASPVEFCVLLFPLLPLPLAYRGGPSHARTTFRRGHCFSRWTVRSYSHERFQTFPSNTPPRAVLFLAACWRMQPASCTSVARASFRCIQT